MSELPQHRQADRLLVVMPTWLGDAIMAMPTLRSLRQLYPKAQITILARSVIRPAIDPCPWVDRIITIRPARKGKGDLRRIGMFNLARRLAAGKFDTAVLLPNSFKTALLVRMAGIQRRVGYDRDGRGFLLSDRLLPRREMGKFVPVPTRDYYLGLTRYLGATDPDLSMQIFTRPEDDVAAERLLRSVGFDSERGRLVLVNPGANYGDAKMWEPARFAQVADRCHRELGATVALTGAPKERAILDQVAKAATVPLLDLPKLGVNLRVLKAVIRRSSLMITNDTGARHLAAALSVPVVTIFGPTDPAWTQIGFEHERQVMVKVFCGPCQKKVCPLQGTADELACMRRITPDMVFEQAAALLRLAPVHT
ncbi:MAG: lipopolysaccharide heptosyltransferase II [Phycisphaeraceae bacterium]|nr:lipopolysaccharide heptosyltransferase II [Phycisphaeraceae bacterium]